MQAASVYPDKLCCFIKSSNVFSISGLLHHLIVPSVVGVCISTRFSQINVSMFDACSIGTIDATIWLS